MKSPLFALLFLFAAIALPLTAAHGQTQSEMNQEALADFKKADARLNKVYQKVLAELDDEGAAKLKASQRAWIAFRDAQAELEADSARGGSMAPMLHASSRATTTEARIEQLQELLKELSER